MIDYLFSTGNNASHISACATVYTLIHLPERKEMAEGQMPDSRCFMKTIFWFFPFQFAIQCELLPLGIASAAPICPRTTTV